MTSDSKPSTLQLVETLFEAFNMSDWARTRPLLAPNIVYEEIGTGRTIEGANAYIEVLTAWKRAFPDGHGTIRHRMASDDAAILEVTWEGTQTGPMDSPAGPISASGKPIRVHAVVSSSVQDNKVVEVRHYIDVMSLLQQIGVMPGAG